MIVEYGKIVGGAGRPMFLRTLGEECTNPYFDVDLAGWTDVGSVTKTRIRDDKSPSGSYLMRVEDSSGVVAGGVKFQWAPGAGTKSFIGGVWLKSYTTDVLPHLCTLAFYEIPDVMLGWKHIQLSDWWDMYSIIVCNKAITTDVFFVVYATDHLTGVRQATVDVGMVYIREISELVVFDAPHDHEHDYIHERIAIVENQRGKRRLYEMGKRYVGVVKHEYMNKLHQEKRLDVSESRNLLYFPHNQANPFFEVSWEDVFKVSYFANKYLGYVATTRVEGLRSTWEKPKFGRG